MWNLIESFCKIHNDEIRLCVTIVCGVEFLDKGEELCFTRAGVSKTVLEVIKDII